MSPVATQKKTTPTGDHPKLPMGGGKGGTLRTVDGKDTVYSPPDPEVKKIAEHHAGNLDEVDRMKTNANKTSQSLLNALLKSKKSHKVTINTGAKSYVFSTDARARLQTKKEKAVK